MASSKGKTILAKEAKKQQLVMKGRGGGGWGSRLEKRITITVTKS